MNEMICIGKIVTTFGIKGELKVVSNFDKCDKAYRPKNKVLINNILHEVSAVRYHKNNILLKIDNKDNINDVLEYVGFNIYIARSDLNLKSDEYLLSDLPGAKVVDNQKNIGVIKEVLQGAASNIVKVRGEKEFLIPLVPAYVQKFSLEDKILYTQNAKDLML